MLSSLSIKAVCLCCLLEETLKAVDSFYLPGEVKYPTQGMENPVMDIANGIDL